MSSLNSQNKVPATWCFLLPPSAAFRPDPVRILLAFIYVFGFVVSPSPRSHSFSMDSPAGTDDPPPFAASGHYSLRPRDRRAPPSTNPRKRPRISIENDVIGDIGEARGYARPMGLAAVLDLALSPSPSSVNAFFFPW